MWLTPRSLPTHPYPPTFFATLLLQVVLLFTFDFNYLHRLSCMLDLTSCIVNLAGLYTMKNTYIYSCTYYENIKQLLGIFFS